MKAFLIRFAYDYYCQGVEEATVLYLVYAHSFQDAIRKILAKFPTARGFEKRGERYDVEYIINDVLEELGVVVEGEEEDEMRLIK